MILVTYKLMHTPQQLSIVRPACSSARPDGRVGTDPQPGYRQRTMTVRRTPASSVAVVRCRPLVYPARRRKRGPGLYDGVPGEELS